MFPPARLGLARLGSAQLGSARLSSARVGLARARLLSAHLGEGGWMEVQWGVRGEDGLGGWEGGISRILGLPHRWSNRRFCVGGVQKMARCTGGPKIHLPPSPFPPLGPILAQIGPEPWGLSYNCPDMFPKFFPQVFGSLDLGPWALGLGQIPGPLPGPWEPTGVFWDPRRWYS